MNPGDDSGLDCSEMNKSRAQDMPSKNGIFPVKNMTHNLQIIAGSLVMHLVTRLFVEKGWTSTPLPFFAAFV